MPSEKRDRQRQNRESGYAARVEAAKAAKKKKSMLRTGILVGLLLLLVVGGALLASNGGDDDDVTAGGTQTTVTTDATSSETTGTTAAGAATGLDDIKCDDRKPEKAGNGKQYEAPPEMTIDPDKKYTVTFDTSCGKIVAELDAKAAPKTVNSFVFLARDGYFDGLTFHRVVKDFVIQGGDPEGSGRGGPGYEFEDELPDKPDYKVGQLAMANAGPDTNGSQFFVITGENGPKILNSNPAYTIFGTVTEGLAAAQKMESFYPEGDDGPPTRELYMFKVEVTES